MSSMNKWMGLGRLGHDADVRAAPSGAEVMHFSMATDHTWRDSRGEIHHETEWHRIVYWARGAKRSHANLRPYMTKGREVLVEGRIRTHEWEREGEKLYRKEIIAETVNMTGGRRDSAPPKDNDRPGEETRNKSRRSRRRRGRGDDKARERGTSPPEPPDAMTDLDDFPY